MFATAHLLQPIFISILYKIDAIKNKAPNCGSLVQKQIKAATLVKIPPIAEQILVIYRPFPNSSVDFWVFFGCCGVTIFGTCGSGGHLHK
jgi:hypothetical protein